MQKLLIATHNPAKIAELSKYLQPLVDKGLQLVSLSDIDITHEPEETGTTLEENAILKAKYYAEKSGLPSLADDGGFEIDILNGEPGVKSNRWLGYKAGDQELIDYTFKRLEGVPLEKRTAKGRLVLCYFNPGTDFQAFGKDYIEGFIAEKIGPTPVPGFPYRAIFIVKQFNKYYDELTHEEHDLVNHRKKAVMQIIPHIEKDLM